MRTISSSLVLIALVILGAFTKPKTLTITSPAFVNNGPIPIKYTCMGYESSPPLHIADVPPEAKSLAIIIFDPDAEVRVPNSATVVKKSTHKKGKHAATAPKETTHIVHGFTHWITWNIEAASKDIPENFKNDFTGMNGIHERTYKGMCPPTGTHHYHFIVYALDTQLNIDKNTDKDGLEKVMEGHIVAKGELVGVFNKNYK